VLSWFRKNKVAGQHGDLPFIDIHSHLLPGLDDGVQSFEESEEIILNFQRLGYKKLITTPHVMSDFFRNTNEDILNQLSEMNAHLRQKGIDIVLEAAAEFYLDEALVARIETGLPLLTFGKNYFLFETNFMTEPLNLREFIFLATTKGYRPVLAHPERYIYLQSNFAKAEDLIGRGVLFQINISSLSGYYSKGAQTTAQKLIDKGYVHFLGSDCHNLQHIQLLEETRKSKYFQKAISLPLLNNTL
jgi:tyrosine-protein phosphatase YwqE